MKMLDTNADGIVEHHSPFLSIVCAVHEALVKQGVLELIEDSPHVKRYRITQDGHNFIERHPGWQRLTLAKL